MASRASLRDTSSYGSGLCKFHVFCDIFTVPESERLPASFPLLHSFALWAATDPSMLDPGVSEGLPFEPISVAVVKKYLAAIRAWHIVQGWPPPLSDDDQDRISWSLRGLENMQGSRKRPIRPPHYHQHAARTACIIQSQRPFRSQCLGHGRVRLLGHDAFW